MSVRTKLILIFLGLSVVPLAALTFISYSNSINSLTQLVERDNEVAAADLQQRVANLNDEIHRRVYDVTQLPEFQALDLSQPLEQPQADRLAQAMRERVGDRWDVFSELEFEADEPILHARAPRPEHPQPPQEAEKRGPAPRAAPPPPGPGPVPDRPPVASPEGVGADLEAVEVGEESQVLVIHGPRAETGTVEGETEGDVEEAWVRIILPDFSQLNEDGEGVPTVKQYELNLFEGLPTDQGLEEMVENLARLPGFLLQTGGDGRSIKLRNMGKELQQELMESSTSVDRVEAEAPDLAAAALTERRQELLLRLEEHNRRSEAFTLPVESVQGKVGNLVARIRPDRLLSEVFGDTAPDENEIAFAVDPLGRLHARTTDDLETLSGLGLARTTEPMVFDGTLSGEATARGPEALRQAIDEPDWIPVIQHNEETGYTFGVVRRVSGELSTIRTAALLNLFFGFVFIGLAGSGIIVFSGRMTRGLDQLTLGARRIAEGDLGHRIEAGRKDELGQLAGAFNEMASDLEVSRQRLVEQERVQRELEIARHIQRDSLPKGDFSGGEIEVVGRSIPSLEVGGDFFNFLPLERNRTAILVGDVSGKGVPAALLMAEAQATLRTLLRYQQDPSRILAQLNREIVTSKPANVYLTLFLGILDKARGTLTFVNAGQTSPFVLRAADNSVLQLDPTARPVGMFEDSEMHAQTIEVNAGDILCLYTDGVVESTQAGSEEFFGISRLEKVVRGFAARPLDDVLNEVAREVTGFHGGPELEDDATLVIARIAWTDDEKGTQPGDLDDVRNKTSEPPLVN